MSTKKAAVYLADEFELADVEYQKGDGKKKQTADAEPPVGGDGNHSAAGQQERSEAPSAHQFLNATMTIQTAIEKLKHKEVDQSDLVVIDVSTLRFLHELTAGGECRLGGLHECSISLLVSATEPCHDRILGDREDGCGLRLRPAPSGFELQDAHAFGGAIVRTATRRDSIQPVVLDGQLFA